MNLTPELKADLTIEAVVLWINTVIDDLPKEDNEKSLDLWLSMFVRLDSVVKILKALKNTATEDEIHQCDWAMQSLSELAYRSVASNVINSVMRK